MEADEAQEAKAGMEQVVVVEPVVTMVAMVVVQAADLAVAKERAATVTAVKMVREVGEDMAAWPNPQKELSTS